MEEKLLDQIKLKDGRELIGIVDFVSTKQLYFFDLSKNVSIDWTLMAILWKGNKPCLRFSVYCALHYPEIQLPAAILVPKNNILESNKEFKETPPIKTVKRIVKRYA